MSLERYPRKPDKPSFNGSQKDALFDQLLRSLQGPKSLPTDKEFSKFILERSKSYGRSSAIPDLTWPYPMQRYHAAELLQAIDWQGYQVARQVLWEAKNIDRASQELEPLPPPDPQAVKAEWITWRASLIQQYALQGIIPPIDTVS